ncbi:MAG: hypothetical protein ACTTJV_00875 [Ottowia sp.]
MKKPANRPQRPWIQQRLLSIQKNPQITCANHAAQPGLAKRPGRDAPHGFLRLPAVIIQIQNFAHQIGKPAASPVNTAKSAIKK